MKIKDFNVKAHTMANVEKEFVVTNDTFSDAFKEIKRVSKLVLDEPLVPDHELVVIRNSCIIISNYYFNLDDSVVIDADTKASIANDCALVLKTCRNFYIKKALTARLKEIAVESDSDVKKVTTR